MHCALHTVCTVSVNTYYTVCTHTMQTAHNALCTLYIVCTLSTLCRTWWPWGSGTSRSSWTAATHLTTCKISHVWRKKEGCYSCHCLKSLEWRFLTFCKMQIKNKIYLCPRRNRKSQDIPTLHKNMRIVNYCCGMLEASKVPACENSSNCGQFAERWKSENGNHCNW